MCFTVKLTMDRSFACEKLGPSWVHATNTRERLGLDLVAQVASQLFEQVVLNEIQPAGILYEITGYLNEKRNLGLMCLFL